MTTSSGKSCGRVIISFVASILVSQWANLETWPQISRFMGPTWGPPGSCRPHMGPMLASWTLLSGTAFHTTHWTAHWHNVMAPAEPRVVSCWKNSPTRHTSYQYFLIMNLNPTEIKCREFPSWMAINTEKLPRFHYVRSVARARFNIKTVLPGIMHCRHKDKTSYFRMRIPIPITRHRYTETLPDRYKYNSCDFMMHSLTGRLLVNGTVYVHLSSFFISHLH